MTCGTTPNTTSAARAPVARMPSTGRGSMDSDGFGEQLREHTEIVNENRHHAGEWTESDRDHEHQRKDDLIDGAAGVHQAADGLHDPLRADIGRAQDRERNAEHEGERRAPDRDLHRHDHVGEIVVPIAKIGLEKRAAELRHVAPVREQGNDAKHFRRRPGPGQEREYQRPRQPAAQAARQRMRGDGNCGYVGGGRGATATHAGRFARSTRIAGDLQHRLPDSSPNAGAPGG